MKSLSRYRAVAAWRWCSQVDDQSARIGLQPARDPGRRRGQGPRDRHHAARRREMGEAGDRAGRSRSRKSARCSPPGDVIYVEPLRAAGPVPAAPDAGNLRRHGGDGSAYRPRAWPWSAASPSTRASSTAPPRRCASRARRSSRSSMRRRSTTATRRRPSSWMRRSKSTWGAGGGIWKPENYGGKFFGPSTLRFGLEQSRNVMTVRLAQDIGMPLIAEYAKRFGVYDELPPYLSYALGAGETTRAAHGHRLFDVRQWRPARDPDADRPHPGSLRPHHLQARPARMHRLRRRPNGTISPSRR